MPAAKPSIIHARKIGWIIATKQGESKGIVKLAGKPWWFDSKDAALAHIRGSLSLFSTFDAIEIAMFELSSQGKVRPAAEPIRVDLRKLA